MMHTTIAIGVTDGLASRAAVRWAMGHAVRDGSDVTLVHVVADSPGSVTVIGSVADLAGAEFLDDEVRYAESIAGTISVTGLQLNGSAMWELVRISQETDLVVIGTHKTGFIHGSVFGSTGLQLVAAALCPVAVVPVGDPSRRMGIVVGLDDSAAGRAALAFAADEAAGLREPLTVVRVNNDAVSSASVGGRETLDASERMLRVAVDALNTSHAEVVVRVQTIQGPTARSLIAASKSARLLVLGDSQRGTARRLVLGAVCHDALMNLVTPTAVVHSIAKELLVGYGAAVLTEQFDGAVSPVILVG